MRKSIGRSLSPCSGDGWDRAAKGGRVEAFHQLGYVTNAVDQARHLFAELHGVHHFRVSERHVEGRCGDVVGTAVLRTALANTASVQIEIIEPRSGLIDAFRDAVPERPFALRLHHLGYRVDGTHDDWMMHLRRLAAQGRQPVWQSMPSTEGAFAYFDEPALLGYFVEYLWATPARWAQSAATIPDASRGFSAGGRSAQPNR